MLYVFRDFKTSDATFTGWIFSKKKNDLKVLFTFSAILRNLTLPFRVRFLGKKITSEQKIETIKKKCYYRTFFLYVSRDFKISDGTFLRYIFSQKMLLER